MRSQRRRAADPVSRAAICLVLAAAPAAHAQDHDAPPLKGALLGEGADLYLDVLVNGRAVGLVAAFRMAAGGALSIAPDELAELGLKTDPAALDSDGRVALARLPGVSAAYDAAAQQVRLTAEPHALLPHVVKAGAPRIIAPEAAADAGAVLNYTLYAAGGRSDRWRFEGVSGLLEGRVFGAFGMISGTVLGRSSGPGRRWRRLETMWSWSDPEGPTTYAAGDVVTGALAWTRPVRLGGVQVRRNFGLRPDLVTHPTADLRGSADVPSTVEVYVDGARRLSAEVPAGPFEVSDLPLTTGAGTARVVVRDALGREVVSEAPFYASSNMLAEGLFDLSAEIGVARRDFGGETDSYDTRLFASGSLRYGVSDALTLEAHGEGGGGLVMGGGGFVARLGSLGALSLAAAASRYAGETGTRLQASIEMAVGDARVFALTQRSSDDFADIASVSALEGNAAPPRALDQIALSLPEPWEGAALTLSYTRLARAGEAEAQIASASFSQDLPGAALVFVSGFANVGDDGYGLFAGVSVPLNAETSLGANVSVDARRASAAAEIIRAERGEPGGFGWRVQVGEDVQAARASYRADFSRLEASVWHGADGMHATAQAEGALVLTGGGLFVSPRIDDAFAVVDTGVPGVGVSLENRPVGKTDSSGLLLVPGLRAYETNRLTIDPDDLPPGADVATLARDAAPRDRAGAYVDFAVSANPAAALVTLVTPGGGYVAPGSAAVLAATGQRFAVGYDGQTYVKGLAAQNRLVVTSPDGGVCVAAFPFAAEDGAQVRTGDVTCAPEEGGS